MLDAGRVERSGQRRAVRGGDADRGGAAAGPDHLVERAAGAQLALRDDDHVVGGLGDLGEQVARDQDRAALGRLGAEHVAHPADARRVEAVGGLVEDQHFGVAQQRGGDREPLAHPHRVALDAAVAGVGDAGQLEDLLDALAGMVARGGEDPQVVAPGAPGVEARVLEHGADLGARVLEVVVDLAVEPRGAGVDPDQPEQHPDRRALAGAVGAEEAGDPARLDLEAEVRDGPDRAEALAQSLDLDRGHRRRRLVGSAPTRPSPSGNGPSPPGGPPCGRRSAPGSPRRSRSRPPSGPRRASPTARGCARRGPSRAPARIS